MKNDFSQGKVWRNIVNQMIPLTLAQMVQLLYNVVDRIYIGHLPGANNMALTGVGVTFPITTLIMAFTYLFGMGGTPLFSIARGAKDVERAKKIMGNVCSMLVISSVVILVGCFIFRKPILYLFGASDASYVYADQYLRIYLCGTTFSMLATGMNGFINAQGFPRMGMLTTVIGAVLNLILDPIFIFGMDMGVAGAALATVISQMVSALWVLRFLTGKKILLPLQRKYMRIQPKLVGEVAELGAAGFFMQGTNCLVQIVCNVTLQGYGGDLYVGIMTVLNSVREVVLLPINGMTSGSQPVLGFNFGAKKYDRVKEGIRFTALVGAFYTAIIWLVIVVFPKFFISIFSNDTAMLETGPEMLKLYFFGFIFMSFQFAGQSSFQALGCAKRAIFFSVLRKGIIVVPLTILLPKMGLGVAGVFIAEPISNALGGLACFVTMWLTLYRKLGKEVT